MTDIVFESLDDILAKFPMNSVKTVSSELKAPCPFCEEDGRGVRYNGDGLPFYGDDRLTIFSSRNGAYCRHCANAQRGRNRNGYYSMRDLAEKLCGRLSDSFVEHELKFAETVTPLGRLWTDGQVNLSHRNVDYRFWLGFGWTEKTIKRFRLGKGTLYSDDPDVHIIPMKLTSVDHGTITDLWYIGTRGVDANGKSTKRHSSGSVKPYVWLVRDDPDNDTIIITEGEKDGITVWQAGFKNFVVSFGTNHWSQKKTEFIMSLGFKDIIVCGDRDVPGRTFSDKVASMFRMQGAIVRVLNWDITKDLIPESVKDVTEVLQKCYSGDEFRRWLDTSLEFYEDLPSQYIFNSKLVEGMENVAEQDKKAALSLGQLRHGSFSLRSQIEQYVNDYPNKGNILLLKAPPGSGKSHALVAYMEDVAIKEREVKLIDKLKLEQSLEEAKTELEAFSGTDEEKAEMEKTVKKLQSKLDNFSFATLALFGQFRDGFADILSLSKHPELWFNYEGRNETNCQNYKLVEELGSANHDVGQYCHIACPFKDSCITSGYLKQEKDKHKSSIVFYRHQHLQSTYPQEHTKLIVVDEDPGHIYEQNRRSFSLKDIAPHSPMWEVDLEDRDSVLRLQDFITALKEVMVSNEGESMFIHGEPNENYMIRGGRVIEILQDKLSAKFNETVILHDYIRRYCLEDVASRYHPTYLGQDSPIKKRFIGDFIKVIAEESERLQRIGNKDMPTRVFINGGRLEFYPVSQIKVQRKTPIVIADATGLPWIYQAMFRRPVDVYAPTVYDPRTRTIQVVGDDYTASTRNRLVKRFREQIEELPEDHILRTATGIDTPYELDYIIAVISKILTTHKSLLVVAHKEFKEVIESVASARIRYVGLEASTSDEPKISFGHYNGLRGTNLYKDYEAVLMIGAFRIPYPEVWYMTNMWAYLLEVDRNLGSMYDVRTDVVSNFHGTNFGHTHPSYKDPLLAEMVDRFEVGEQQQCAERIRPHTSMTTTNGKLIVVLSSRPALRFITDIFNKKSYVNVVAGDSYLKFKEFVLKYMEDRLASTKRPRKIKPSYKLIAKELGITSNSTITRYMKLLEKDVGV